MHRCFVASHYHSFPKSTIQTIIKLLVSKMSRRNCGIKSRSPLQLMLAAFLLVLSYLSVGVHAFRSGILPSSRPHMPSFMPARTMHLFATRDTEKMPHACTSRGCSSPNSSVTKRELATTKSGNTSIDASNNNYNWMNKKNMAVAMGASSMAALLLTSPGAANAAVDLAGLSGGAAAANSYMENLLGTGFYQAFSLVFLSEIGDKTFFIAGLLAMKTSRLISFLGSMGALSVMTVISVVIGQAFHAVPPGLANGLPLDDLAAVAAFTFFGVKILSEALGMEEGEVEEGELTGMQEELADAEEAVESNKVKETTWGQLASIFALVFAAEFGDRSFLSTIALSAAQNPVSVAGGAIAAHGIATAIAVFTGALAAKYISERVVGLVSGTLFLVFAVTTAVGIF